MKVSAFFFLALIYRPVGKPLNQRVALPVSHVYEYQDSKTRQTAVVRFVTEKHVTFTVRFLNKTTGKVCQTQGHAFWDDPTGNGALAEDDEGNSYGAVDFYSKVAPLYVSLSFEYPRNGKVSVSQRLQIWGADVPEKTACYFQSKHTLKRIK